MTTTETASTFASAGVAARPRRVIAGETMVTPIDPVRIDGGERLKPRRDRLALGHPFVQTNPELFIAADPKDTSTRDHLRTWIKRNRQAGGSRRAAPSITGKPRPQRLRPTGRQSWRLP